ncbi:bis(5'-nucleosyl)-tetraphosphatase (symmetrical) YqeK [uncultured Adlercreutzia sp.]|uniref:bis(5'-nucleosyl)-tetraphosphatase (symmetrical) YqeK n=1 Tax=uncultured Adlercreutzia sp. TaxID=875803 RepID=UPI0026F39E7C|nr:bis(5'-nucleosyl)-tetraphosphatase (symmetrical) YqeK [uncultured Adlercreutzia sp.]
MTVDTHSDEYFEARRAELAERVGPRRFSHSLGVSQTAEQLAEVYGADAGEARIAGLLHDWDKGYDDPGILQRVEELGMEVDLELLGMPRVLHGMTAAVALGRQFPELSPAVLQAIDRHTVGAPGMTDLDMIVYVADALEPGRKGKVVEKLRAKVGEVPLHELFLDTYAYWVQLIMDRRHPMYSKTVDIWNSYMPAQEVYHSADNPDPLPYGRP